ncbi:MAG: hypothetical protein PVH35_06795 [Syntrophobacterales bacterium]
MDWKFGARLSEVILAPARRAVGGLGGVEKARLRKFFFVDRRSSPGDRLDRTGAFKPSHRQGIGVGIRRGTIDDCGGSLCHSRLVEWGIEWGNSAIQKEKDHDYS